MNKFYDAQCPVCKNKLGAEDNIVVCPDCGTPYHRECINKTGKCLFEDKHSEGYHFEPPKKTTDTEEKIVCYKCGFVNEKDTIYCNSCGTILNNQQSQPFGKMPNNENPYINNSQFGMPLYGIQTETVDPDEEIDGIKAGDIATYVGENSQYFLPRFKDLKSNTKKYNRFNLSALLIQQWYFLYRKMWLMAALTFVGSMILSIPRLFDYINSLNMSGISFDRDIISSLSLICYFLSVVFRGIISYFSNIIYMNIVFKNIKKIKSKAKTDEEYKQMLSAKGSVSKVAPIVAFSICFAAILMLTVVLSFFMNFSIR